MSDMSLQKVPQRMFEPVPDVLLTLSLHFALAESQGSIFDIVLLKGVFFWGD